MINGKGMRSEVAPISAKKLNIEYQMTNQAISELTKGIEAQLLEIEKERAAEQSQENIILLVSNADCSEYDLLNVKGMERTEIFNLLWKPTLKDPGHG